MSNKKNWGCFLDLFLLTIVLAILSAIAIPQFTSIKKRPISSLIKDILVNGIKECIVRDADDKTTNFVDAASLSLKDSRFKVIAISSILYLCLIPISYFHYTKIKKEKNITSDKDDGLEDIL